MLNFSYRQNFYKFYYFLLLLYVIKVRFHNFFENSFIGQVAVSQVTRTHFDHNIDIDSFNLKMIPKNPEMESLEIRKMS